MTSHKVSRPKSTENLQELAILQNYRNFVKLQAPQSFLHLIFQNWILHSFLHIITLLTLRLMLTQLKIANFRMFHYVASDQVNLETNKQAIEA